MSDPQFTWLQPRALAEADDEQDDRLLLLDGHSQPTSPPLPNHSWPALQPRMFPDESSHDGLLTYVRAAGVDAVAEQLSIQNLRLETQPPSSASQPAATPRSSVIPYPPRAVTPASLAPPPFAESRPRVASPTPPAVNPPRPPRGEDRIPSRRQASSLREDDRPKRAISSKFHDTIQSTRAMQKLVEGKICTTTKCSMLDLPTDAPTDVYDGTKMEVDLPSIQPDNDQEGDAEIEISLIEQLAEARRGSATLGMRRAGLPLYRSSTEAALRCQNLVRNKPRMRKRTKLRHRPTQSHMPAAAGSTVASTSTP